jgi:hypothetical protein
MAARLPYAEVFATLDPAIYLPQTETENPE